MGTSNIGPARCNAHEDEPDPHGVYQKVAEKGQANGYAALDSSGLVPAAQVPPLGAAGGELAGTYPNPTVAATHAGSAHHAAFVQADHDALPNSHHSNATDHTAAHGITSANHTGFPGGGTTFLRDDGTCGDIAYDPQRTRRHHRPVDFHQPQHRDRLRRIRHDCPEPHRRPLRQRGSLGGVDSPGRPSPHVQHLGHVTCSHRLQNLPPPCGVSQRGLSAGFCLPSGRSWRSLRRRSLCQYDGYI
jgi:hypothetical protein